MALLNPTYELLKAESVPDSGDVILTIRCTPGWILGKLGRKVVSQRYLGSCTVWYKLPRFRRPDVFMESMLSNMYDCAKFNKMIPSGDT